MRPSPSLVLLLSLPALADDWDIDLAQEVVTGSGGGGQEFAAALAAGDLNGDGVDDLVVSAPGAGRPAR